MLCKIEESKWLGGGYGIVAHARHGLLELDAGSFSCDLESYNTGVASVPLSVELVTSVGLVDGAVKGAIACRELMFRR